MIEKNKEEAGKLYCTSPSDWITIGIPRKAVLFAVPFMMLPIYVLRSGVLSKFQSTSP